MPARQDQTLQIFLIIFIFAFLVSAVVAYLGWKGYSDAEQLLAKTKTELQAKGTQVSNMQSEIEQQREMMGFGKGDNAPDVEAAFVADMTTMGGGVVEAQKVTDEAADIPDWKRIVEAGGSYKKVLSVVFQNRQELAREEATLKEQRNALAKQLQAVEAKKEAQVAQAEAAMKKAQQDAASERSAFKQDRSELETTKQQLQKSLDQQRTNHEKQIADRDTQIKNMTDEIAKLKHAVANLIEQRKDEPGSFEVADGRVSWVNQNGTVWINIGSADSLRRQVTFSVYDADQHDAAKAEKKGSIEVTRILGEHMAEARITDDSATNPIIVGDHIYSQVWHLGKKLRFAITGIIDLDGDGQSDLQLARELIELNGGVVDAYLSEEGKVEGNITANTRYLVLGDEPETAAEVKLQEGWHSMSQTATALGVESITVPEFLAQMGYRPQDRTVPLGAGATARDFPAQPEDADSPAVSAPRFRPRPPTRAPAPIPPQ
jgi:hypothetical protein